MGSGAACVFNFCLYWAGVFGEVGVTFGPAGAVCVCAVYIGRVCSGRVVLFESAGAGWVCVGHFCLYWACLVYASDTAYVRTRADLT